MHWLSKVGILSNIVKNVILMPHSLQFPEGGYSSSAEVSSQAAGSLSDATHANAGCLGATGHVAATTVEAREPAGSRIWRSRGAIILMPLLSIK